MLCGPSPNGLSTLPTGANHAIWSRFMSTLFSTAHSPGLTRHRNAVGRHKFNSWLRWTALLSELSRWSERSRQRAALRDLADDRHLLNDLGLTRQEALDEANRPFWE
jgi:uncharacterized protein YjiS (DUF1127 family)